MKLEKLDWYFENLEQMKGLIDKTPNKFLNFHYNDSIKTEKYELAAYIKEVAGKREFNLIKKL